MLARKFEEQEEKTPGHIAVKAGDQVYTYTRLNRYANRIAHLVKEAGAGDIVGVLFRHGVHMIAALIGALKAGKIVVPLSVDYPRDRLAYMLTHSGATLLLTDTHHITQAAPLAGKNQIPVLEIDPAGPENSSIPAENLKRIVKRDQPAYILYTSGSTGRPKGVVQTHRNTDYYSRSWVRFFSIDPTDRMTLFSSFSHDASIPDLYSALHSGAALYPFNMRDPDIEISLSEFLVREKITIWHSVPTLFSSFAGTLTGAETFPDLRFIVLGGEAVREHEVRLFNRNFPQARLANVYGQTEATVNAIHIIEPGSPYTKPLVGPPLEEIRLFVIDEEGDPVTPLRSGEILAANPYISPGYWNNPEAGQDTFGEDKELGRLYWTGDLGRLLVDGNIEFLGRRDFQVKIRGYRVELGEIESRLLEDPRVEEAVVTLRKDESGEDVLCAYLVPGGEGQSPTPGVETGEIRQVLAAKLPDYMIPTHFVMLDRMPRTPSGKIDRKALPAPGDRRTGQPYDPPRDEIERRMAAIWSGVLGVKEDIGMGDDFFRLGGHSLRATIMAARIQKEMGVNIPLLQIFKTPRPRDLAGYVKAALAPGRPVYEPIQPAEKREYYPLSSVQRRLYAIQRMDPGNTGYNLSLVLDLEGNLETCRFESTFRRLVARHESLRTGFPEVEGEAVQRVHDEVGFEIEYYDLATGGTLPQTKAFAGGAGGRFSRKEPPCPPEAIIKSFIRPFDLSQAPLLRVGLIECGEGSWVFMVDMHHIITDGTSQGIITAEFLAMYAGERLSPLKLSYKDYTQWENRPGQKEVLERQGDYWKGLYEGEIPVLDLPLDYPRPLVQEYEGRQFTFEIEAERTGALKVLALREQATLFMVILSACTVLLSKLSGQEDIIVGTAVAARRDSELQPVVGMFVNTLPLRNFPWGEQTYRRFLAAVKESTIAAYENQEYPFEDLLEWLTPVIKRDLGRNPLFDVMLVLQNIETVGGEIPGLVLKPYDLERRRARFDITLMGYEAGEKLVFACEYSTKLFKEETLRRYVGYFKAILATVVETPGKKIKEIGIITEAEKKQILIDFNETRTDYPEEKTIYELFAEQEEASPDRIALVGPSILSDTSDLSDLSDRSDLSITYRELHEISRHLAQGLIEKGIRADSIVGIMTPQSLEMVIGILGILSAGGAYMPIDPGYPQERIDYMIKDSGAVVVLTAPTIKEALNRSYRSRRSYIKPGNPPSSLAYIIYTSGSTGRPKGTLIQHGSLLNLCCWHNRCFGVTAADRATKYAGVGFDASVWELFPYLIVGASIYIVPGEIKSDPNRLNRYFETCQITTAFLPTQVAEMFMALENLSLRILLTGGDKLRSYIKRNYRLVNNYGPTENTVVSTSGIVTEETVNIPIGKPIDNTRVYILNLGGCLQPVGVPGELSVGGMGLARGYLNQPGLTSEKFIMPSATRGSFEKPLSAPRAAGLDPVKLLFNYHSPFTIHHSPLYKTGDLARWLPGGDLEFLGRIDSQVKIRGFRIETGEIESQLLRYQGIKGAVVISEEKDGDRYLCAYIVAEKAPDPAELRAFLTRTLPGYMVPAYFESLEAIPLTPHGKLDSKALPAPGLRRNHGAEAPRDEIEKALAAIWSGVLNIPKIGIDDHFFEIGGHSLKATQLATRIHREMGIKIPIEEIFKAPRLREMARYLRAAQRERYTAIQPSEQKEYYPLTSAQNRFYILQQVTPAGTAYNMTQIYWLKGRVVKEKFAETLGKMIRRHEILRTSFRVVRGRPVQVVHQEVEFAVENYHPGTSFLRPFDLARAPLLRLGLLQWEEEKVILMFDMHHIIFDGGSMSIFLEEFMGHYVGREAAPLRLQYRDFAQWQEERLRSGKIGKEEGYWQEQYRDGQPVLEMVPDFPRPPVQRYEGDQFNFILEASETAAFNRLLKETGSTLFMGLLAVYNVLLARYTGQEDIVLGTTIAGRSHPDLEQLLGLLIETLAIRNQPRGRLGFQEFLKEVKQVTLDAYANQDYPFRELIKKLGAENELSRNPVFDVMLIIQNLDMTELRLEGLEFSPFQVPEAEMPHMSKVDLTIEAAESAGAVYFRLEYCTALYKRETMERLAGHFINIIKEAAQNPTMRLSDIQVIGPEEKRRLLEVFNTPVEQTEPKDPEPVLRRYADQVARTPDRIAQVGPFILSDLSDQSDLSDRSDLSITYRELHEKSRHLAQGLIEKGIRVDSIVGIMIPRSVEMVIGILGILQAGAAYMPIEPGYPRERIDYMIRDSKPVEILTAPTIKEVLNRSYRSHMSSISPGTPGNPPASSLAYIIYTSGSTGRPKGVIVEHRNLSYYIDAFEREFGLNPGDTVVQQASYAFDAFVEELYPILLRGGKLVIAGKEILEDIPGFVEILNRHRVTLITCSPQLLSQLNAAPVRPAYLRIRISGGDRLKAEDIVNLREVGVVYNTYGPTETTVCATYYRCPAGQALPTGVPIGKPITHYRVYILDRNLRLLPGGVAGEICIAGGGVTRGYLNRPELTMEKFCLRRPGGSFRENRPLDPRKSFLLYHSPLTIHHSPIYKTGDLARWNSEGNIEFIGRIDRQVKIRGYRIELGEIENRLAAMAGIAASAVVEGTRATGQKYLVAYVVSRGPLDLAKIKSQLAQQLPGYMIPTYIVEAAEIPRTASGKVDIKRLPRPEVFTAKPQAIVGSRAERIVADTWKEVLEIDRVGVEDHFFDLGGTSLDIFKVNTRLNEVFNREIPVVALFRYSTVRSLARYLEAEPGAEGNEEEKQQELSEAVNQGKAALEKIAGKAQGRGDEIPGAEHDDRRTGLEIAVIGMAGIFPGARDIDEFWENLKNGSEGIGFLTEEELQAEGIPGETLESPNYIKARGLIEGVEYFDEAFFAYTPMEAQLMDPQIRIFAQCLWHALEDAGYDPYSYDRRIGLYAGASPNLQWEALTLYAGPGRGINGFMAAQLIDKDFMCTHISYKLNLKGPSYSLQTACSTSLVAIHWAVRGLLSGECEMATAGGVSIHYPPKKGYQYQPGMIFSADGHNRSFAAEASGSVFGDGAGVVVLKRLDQAEADHDQIYAVIKGTATNNDGIRKVGYTAPSVEAQAEVIKAAHLTAGVEPESITYIEAHGTATPLGDTVEIEALKQAFQTKKKGYCGIGTVKSSVGHLYTAAGVAGFIKTALAIKHRLIPPTLHYETPNPQIDLSDTPFYVNTRLKEWKPQGYPLRAGVSSFGIGGTNAHIILEEWPQLSGQGRCGVSPLGKSLHGVSPSGQPRQNHLILLSAKTPTALDKMTRNLLANLEKKPGLNLADLAYTLHVGRKHFPYRRMVLGPALDSDPGKLALYINRIPTALVKEENPPVVFMFCGQGTQYVEMGLDLYRSEPLFAREIDRCFEILKPLMGLDLKDILYPSKDSNRSNMSYRSYSQNISIDQTEITQPVVFTFEYALARLLMHWGIKPHAMIGYSFGEYIAACIAGVYTLEDALRLIVARGQLTRQTPEGAMTSVPLREEELKPLLRKDLSLAIVNGPTCVVTGARDAVAAFEQEMKQRRVLCVRLNMSQAIHSTLMEPIRREFEKSLGKIRLHPPQIPYISNVTAQWITGAEAVEPGYWGDHLCSTVRFSDGIKELLKLENAIFVEIGAGRVLGMMVRTHPDKKPGHLVLNTVKHQQEKAPDDYFLLEKIGQLWLHGQRLDWRAIYENQARTRVSLPGYPFEGKRYWLDIGALQLGQGDTPGAFFPTEAAGAESPAVPGPGAPPGIEISAEDLPDPGDELEQTIAREWQELLGIRRIGKHDDFFYLNGSSLVAMQMMARLMDRYRVEIPMNRFYEKPTIAHLAGVIKELTEGNVK